MGSTSGSLGTVSSNVNDDLGLATVASPSYPSNELIRQLAAQTGAQLPFNTSQHSLLQAPSSRVEDLSLYDTSAPPQRPFVWISTPEPIRNAWSLRHYNSLAYSALESGP